FNFTHQGAEWVGAQADEWLGTPWNDLDAERAAVRQEFAAIKLFEQTYNIPIHIGEFGSYSKADQASRLRWSTYMARYIESLGYSWAYWEWSAGFGVYDPVTGVFKQELLDALVKNTLPEPTKTILTPIYDSNFATSSGWNFFTSNGAAGTMGVGDNLLNINISRAGSAGWHAQLVRNGFSIIKGKMYKLSFEAKSNSKLPISFYLGKASDPWNSYSGFSSVQLTNEYQEYSNLFTMTSPTDLAARMVFDLGSQAGDATFRKVKLEEVTLDFSSSVQLLDESRILLYPNPVNNLLIISGLGSGISKIDVLDQSGKVLSRHESIGETTEIPVGTLPSGSYICRIMEGDRLSSHRFIKQ
nr:carbohydrate binding domain-containing protein [Saprospiraceae bacterium]